MPRARRLRQNQTGFEQRLEALQHRGSTQARGLGDRGPGLSPADGDQLKDATRTEAQRFIRSICEPGPWHKRISDDAVMPLIGVIC